MNMKKILAFALCLVLVAGLSIGGTLAWITATTDTLQNTFVVGNIKIKLDELSVDGTERITTGGNQYKLVPGTTYTKDPTVTVEAGSEKCYLFVEFVEEGNASTYLDYTSTFATEGWTQGTGSIPTNVWYRVVEADDEDQSWLLLKDGKIKIRDTVTADNMNAASAAKLSYTAYAVQYDNLTADKAWENRTTKN